MGYGVKPEPFSTKSSEFAERVYVVQDALLYLGERRSNLVILLLSERRGQMPGEPVEMLANDPADFLAAGDPIPGVRRRPARPARHARQRRHAERPVGLREHLGPGSQVGEEPVEHPVQGLRPGNPAAGLPDVQDRVNDLAEHLVEGDSRILARGRAHPVTLARAQRPAVLASARQMTRDGCVVELLVNVDEDGVVFDLAGVNGDRPAGKHANGLAGGQVVA